jgi:putative flippase GtrA
MVSMMNKELIRTIKFTVFSLSAGVIQFTTTEVLHRVFKLIYGPSYFIGLVLSVLWNFTLNREFTFKSANNVPIAMVKVALFYVVFISITTPLGHYLVENLHWNDMLVTIMIMICNFVTEYLYDRFYVFRDSIDTKVK